MLALENLACHIYILTITDQYLVRVNKDKSAGCISRGFKWGQFQSSFISLSWIRSRKSCVLFFCVLLFWRTSVRWARFSCLSLLEAVTLRAKWRKSLRKRNVNYHDENASDIIIAKVLCSLNKLGVAWQKTDLMRWINLLH